MTFSYFEIRRKVVTFNI